MQTGRDNVCLAFSENQCAGLCRSEERLEGIYRDCVLDAYNAGAGPLLPPLLLSRMRTAEREASSEGAAPCRGSMAGD